ncbi:hypothetical protein ACUY2E_10260 [Corynebacterium confusum]
MAEAKKTTAKSPAKAEAQGTDVVTFNVEINGTEINLEAPANILDADAEAYIAYEEGKYGLMMKSILGDLQWRQLRSAGMTTNQMMEIVFSAYQEAAGLGEG